jgi:hypothetical protein
MYFGEFGCNMFALVRVVRRQRTVALTSEVTPSGTVLSPMRQTHIHFVQFEDLSNRQRPPRPSAVIKSPKTTISNIKE